MSLFSPSLRAERMTVGTATVLLQMSKTPVVFGCAETVAKRLTRCTASAPACAVQTAREDGTLEFALTDYGMQVKEKLEKWICLSAN